MSESKGATLRVDNTMLSCFTTCPRKFYWRHIRHLVKDSGKVPALEFGKAIHKGLEVFYLTDSQDEALEAFIKDFDSEASDGKRNLENGAKILKSYFKQYVPEKWEVVAVEQNLHAEIEPGLDLYGYIDLVVAQQGQRFNVEHKTSSNFALFIASPNHQISGYDFLSKANGFEVDGSIVNILGVFKTKTENRRSVTSRTEEQMESYLSYVKTTGAEIRRCEKDNFYPQYTNSCWNCPFKELCNTDSSLIEKIIDFTFKKEEWTPWVSRSEEVK